MIGRADLATGRSSEIRLPALLPSFVQDGDFSPEDLAIHAGRGRGLVAKLDRESGEWSFYAWPSRGTGLRNLAVVERAGLVEGDPDLQGIWVGSPIPWTGWRALR